MLMILPLLFNFKFLLRFHFSFLFLFILDPRLFKYLSIRFSTDFLTFKLTFANLSDVRCLLKHEGRMANPVCNASTFSLSV